MVRIAAVLGALWAGLTHCEELITNGSFEQTVHDFPAGWSRTIDPDNGVEARWVVDSGRDGGNALRIEVERFPDPGQARDSSHADTMCTGFAIESGRTYTLTFWAKGRSVADGTFTARLYDTSTWSSPPLFEGIAVNAEWRRYAFSFVASAAIAPEHTLLWFTLGGTGAVWIDDVSLVVADGAAPVERIVPVYQPRAETSRAINLVRNGSFETGPNGWTSFGEELVFGGNLAGVYGEIDEGGAVVGGKSFRVPMGPGVTPESYFDCWPPEHRVQNRLLLANEGWITVEPGAAYTLSAYLRSDRPGTRAMLHLMFAGDAEEALVPLSRNVELTAEWKRYEFTVTAPKDSVFVSVGPDLPESPKSPLAVWIDGIQLEQAEQASKYTPFRPVEIGFNTQVYGNVYDAAVPVRLEALAIAQDGTPRVVDVAMSLTDYWGETVATEQYAVAAGADEAAQTIIELPLEPGYYEAAFSWDVDETACSRNLRFAVIHPYGHDDSPFGFNHAPNTPEAIEQTKTAGIVWARDWAVNWEWAEPVPGKMSFTSIEPHIRRLEDAGVQILSLLPSNPSTNWASEAPDSVPAERWKRLAYAPRDPDLLYAFIAEGAEFFKGRVRYWEFLNEPLWVPEFCLPQKGGYSHEDYMELLKGFATTVRRVDPDATILGGYSIQAEMPFGDEFIRAGGLEFVDIYNLHPYAGTRTPEAFIPDMERILAAMDAEGLRKPIWATETGYYGIDQYPYLPWTPPPYHFSANRLLADELQSGNYIVRFSTILLAHGVEKIFWHEPKAGGPNQSLKDIENSFVGSGAVPRKAFAAHAALANVLGPRPAFAQSWRIPDGLKKEARNAVFGYAFDTGNSAVLIAWTTAGVGEWFAEVPQGVTVTNVVGGRVTTTPAALSESPLYIVSESLSASALAQSVSLIRK